MNALKIMRKINMKAALATLVLSFAVTVFGVSSAYAVDAHPKLRIDLEINANGPDEILVEAYAQNLTGEILAVSGISTGNGYLTVYRPDHSIAAKLQFKPVWANITFNKRMTATLGVSNGKLYPEQPSGSEWPLKPGVYRIGVPVRFKIDGEFIVADFNRFFMVSSKPASSEETQTLLTAITDVNSNVTSTQAAVQNL